MVICFKIYLQHSVNNYCNTFHYCAYNYTPFKISQEKIVKRSTSVAYLKNMGRMEYVIIECKQHMVLMHRFCYLAK